MIKNYLPTDVYPDIFKINYEELKNQGITSLFFDLDNTLLPYNLAKPSDEVVELIKKIRSLGIDCYLLSNSPKARVEYFATYLGFNGYLSNIGKPNKAKAQAYLDNLKVDKECCMLIGDQILTDILCANRLLIKSILVKSINRTNEPWYTKINRLRENIIIRKLDKVNHEIATKIIKLTRN